MEKDTTLDWQEFSRLANNFYIKKGVDADSNRIGLDLEFINYFKDNAALMKEKFKVAFIWICLNQTYWEFAKPMIEGAKQFFLPGHNVDYFLWSDMPESSDEKFWENLKQGHIANGTSPDEAVKMMNEGKQYVDEVRKTSIVFSTEGVEWPMPTLMRYHLFLQQEELLREYDYIFYCDVDMKFENIVGDEILGDGLTSGVIPMYNLDKTMWPPYEPNEKSTAYIPRPGRVISDNGQPRFQPLYYAGGFQGGKADKYLEAMKVMKQRIDEDMRHGYVAIWNEESHWNKFLSENPPSVVLNPSYIYPDSLINEYYVPRWGRNFQPKLITLTKKNTLRPLSPEEQKQLTMMKK